MKIYQVEGDVCMTVEIEAENMLQAEAMVREAYQNESYILDSEYFIGVEFTTKKKEMDARNKNQKRHVQER